MGCCIHQKFEQYKQACKVIRSGLRSMKATLQQLSTGGFVQSNVVLLGGCCVECFLRNNSILRHAGWCCACRCCMLRFCHPDAQVRCYMPHDRTSHTLVALLLCAIELLFVIAALQHTFLTINLLTLRRQRGHFATTAVLWQWQRRSAP